MCEKLLTRSGFGPLSMNKACLCCVCEFSATIAPHAISVAELDDRGDKKAPADEKKKKKKWKEDTGMHGKHAASGEDVTVAAQEGEDEPAKRKRKKKSKSNKKPLQGAGIEAEETYDGAFIHIFVS